MDELARLRQQLDECQALLHESRKAEAKANERAEFFKTVVDGAENMIVMVVDREGCITFCSRSIEKHSGYSSEEIVGMSGWDFSPPEELQLKRNVYDALMEKPVGSSERWRLRMPRKDGSWHDVEVVLVNRLDDPVQGIVAYLRVVTVEMAAQKGAQEVEEALRTVFNSVHDGIFVLDLDGNIVHTNGKVLEMFGLSSHEVWHLTSADRYFAAQANGLELSRMWEQVLERDAQLFEWKAKRPKDGGLFDVEVFLRKIALRGQDYVLAAVHDITDRKKAEEALRKTHDELESRVRERTASLNRTNTKLMLEIAERKHAEEALRQSEKRYRALFDGSRDGIYITGGDGELIDANQSFLDLFDYSREDMIGSRLQDLCVNATDTMLFEQDLGKNGSVKDYRLRVRRKDTKELDCLVTASVRLADDGTVLGHQGIVRDITERKILEQQLAHAQKMEAIGTLAGGIAHDFNNILYAIIGYTELVLDEIPDGTLMHSNLEAVLRSGERAKDLVTQILTFSRQSRQEERPILIAPILKETVKFLRASLPTTIELRQSIDTEVGTVRGDPTQVHQVIMNLCTNAGHAMREHGGIMEIGLHTVELDSSFVAGHPPMVPGPHARITVSDTGHGMGTEVVERIFEPYFTTKKQGEGTGLGLAVVHGIVKAFGGTITVTSQPQHGSTFRVYLPIVMQEAKAESSEPIALPTGDERILLVDDEPDVVELCRHILERLGYRVLTKTSSIEALELFRDEPHEFDLVMTDMTMPHMTGTDFSRELLSIRPDIPIILCTGFSERITEEQAMAMGIRAFAMKPILRDRIAITVRRVLDEHRQEREQ